MAEKGKVRTDCIYASNPFHECTDYCLIKTAESKMLKEKKHSGSFVRDISKSFGRKKKGSRAKSPGGLPVSSTLSSEIQSPISFVSPKKMIESRNGDSIYSPKLRSEEIHGINYFPNKEQSESPRSVAASIEAVKPNYTKEIPKDHSTSVASTTNKTEEHEKLQVSSNSTKEEVIVPPSKSSFSFTGIAHHFEDSYEEEIESVASESCVSVGKYRIKTSLASILQSIFNKYGDIAASCKLESFYLRSYYLECVCYVVQEIQSNPFPQLSKSKAKEFLSILKDVESSEIDVSWLRGVLDEIADAIELRNQRRAIEMEKEYCDLDLEETKKQLESRMEDLALKEKELVDAKLRVDECKARLSELEMKCSKLGEVFQSIGDKLDNFTGKSSSSVIL